jgi:LPS-assembly lipoprotein
LLSNPKIFALAAALALTGCGFSPLYGQSGDASVAQKLDMVSVQNIPDRTGQLLRLALQTQLHAAGAPAQELYSLSVSYNLSTAGIGIQQDSSVTRNRVSGTATWRLTPLGAPSAPLATGHASTEDAANVIDQQYFALTLETDTVNQQVADQLAAAITTQLAAYFRTHPNA